MLARVQRAAQPREENKNRKAPILINIHRKHALRYGGFALADQTQLSL